MTINNLSEAAYHCAIKRKKIKHGTPAVTCEKAIQAELDELKEALHNVKSEHVPTITSYEEELADVIITCLSTAYHLGFDIERIIEEKMKFNEKRKK
ncbi:MAG: MazG-like family protein [Rikenellaceae bacterium]